MRINIIFIAGLIHPCILYFVNIRLASWISYRISSVLYKNNVLWIGLQGYTYLDTKKIETILVTLYALASSILC